MRDFFARHYGAHPLNLLALLASFALAGYAAVLLVQSRPIAVIVWFVGAAVGHDLILLPLYAIVDRPLLRFGRRHPDRPPNASWINYVRVPALLSGLLLLVYLPSIAGLSGIYTDTTDLPASRYFARWLAVTGTLFLLSALAFAVHLRRNRTHRSAHPDTAPTPG